MNRINVTLHIIPSEVDPYDLEDYDEIRDGKIKSNTREIKVNKVESGYSIVYDGEIFERMDPAVFGRNVIKIFQANVPNAIIDMRMIYHFDLTNGDSELDPDVAEKIMKHDQVFNSIKDSNFRYHRSQSIIDTWKALSEANNDDDDDDDDEYDSDDPWGFGFDDDEDDDDLFGFLDKNMKKKSRGRMKSENYGRSKVFKNANNPKRSYRRHGVLVADSKDDIKRDEKILKAFLKDFIPGSQDWKKDLRHDVLKRWMKMYALSKKSLKELERDYRKSRRSSNGNIINGDKALDFTRRLFNVPIDNWSDPNK